MKLLLTKLFLFLSISLTAQQSVDFDFFYNQKFESVIIYKYSIKSKTLSAPSIDINASIEKEKKVKIYERKLTKKEICKLLKKMKNIKKKHILDTNYDIKIDFFHKNKMIQEIEISSISDNILIKKKNCKKQNEIDPCLFLGNVTSKLKKYINRLISK